MFHSMFPKDIPGKMTFKESDALSPGNGFTTFSTPWCEVGLGICYDIRSQQSLSLILLEVKITLINHVSGLPNWPKFMPNRRIVNCWSIPELST